MKLVDEIVPPTRNPYVNTSEENKKRATNGLARAGGAIAAGFGLITLLGWSLELPLLASLGPGWIPMAPSTALLFLLFGAALFLCAGPPVGRGAGRIGMAVGAAGALAALLLLVLSLLGMALPAEHLGFAIAQTLNDVPVGHMSPLTALCFVLAGGSLLASLGSSPDRPWKATTGFVLACLVIFASTVFLLSYLFGTPVLYGGKFIPPALTSSLAFAALGAGLYLLAALRSGAAGEGDAASQRASRSVVLVMVFVAAGLIAAGYLYFQRHDQNVRRDAEQKLTAIAELKRSELVAYRKERLADASIFKRQVNALSRELGRAEPFNLAFADAPADPINEAKDSSSPAAGTHR